MPLNILPLIEAAANRCGVSEMRGEEVASAIFDEIVAPVIAETAHAAERMRTTDSVRIVQSVVAEMRQQFEPSKMCGIWQTEKGWFAQTSEGVSGPWAIKEAAEFVADGDFKNAAMLELRSKKT